MAKTNTFFSFFFLRNFFGIQAAQSIYEEVTATIQGYQEKLATLATWVANLDEQCPYIRDITTGLSSRTPDGMTEAARTICLELATNVATKLAESNMEKQMSSMKAASEHGKTEVCSNEAVDGSIDCVRVQHFLLPKKNSKNIFANFFPEYF